MVPTITVDTLSSTLNLLPDLIKIDVEGAENEVLEGSKKICSDYRKTRILVEMHSNPEMPMSENVKQVLSWCQGVCYSAWYLKEGVLLKSVDSIAHRGRCHLLLQPAEWDYPSWLKMISQGDPLEKLRTLFPSEKFRFH